MKKELLTLAILSMMVSCGQSPKEKDAADKDSIQTALMSEQTAKEPDNVAETPAATDAPVSAYSNVTKWEIAITGVTFISETITKEETDRINNTEYDDYWAEYNEETHEWEAHGHAEVVMGTVSISDPKIVSQLNDMMQKPDYESYAAEVKISGAIASAQWYGGNRGGGIDEDFPSNISAYINKHTVMK